MSKQFQFKLVLLGGYLCLLRYHMKLTLSQVNLLLESQGGVSLWSLNYLV